MTDKNKKWIDAKKRFRLSDTHIQMARELGMNPKKFGSLANHKQEPWKAPLPDFIEDIYYKRFKKDKPGVGNPDGHLKIPHLWPGQNPPPSDSRTVVS